MTDTTGEPPIPGEPKLVSFNEHVQRPVPAPATLAADDHLAAHRRMCALNVAMTLFAGSRDTKGLLGASRQIDRFLRTGK